MKHKPRSIVIIGGGFSGMVLAANLLRRAPHQPLQITLVERSPQLGGPAYAARDYPYLLNVPAARMSADSRRPGAFLEFARRRAPSTGAEDFVPRAWYGDYLRQMLAEAQAGAPRARLERVHGDVTHLSRAGAGFRVALRDGRVLRAGEVVLASGNPPPAQLPALEAIADHPRYVRDGCRDRGIRQMNGEVLLVGTGLTMADAALAAGSRGASRVFAISRRGLLPPPQTSGSHAVRSGLVAGGLAQARTPRAMLRAARQLAQQAEAAGGDWRSIVNEIREEAPALWRRLDRRGREQFLRHLRPYWDIHRHRLPGTTSDRLSVMRGAGLLHVHAGRILDARPDDGRLQVTWLPRGAEAPRTLTVDWIVNCTGPDYDLRRSQDPMIRVAIRDGLVVPDDSGLGVRTGERGALLDAEGRVVAGLYCLGPMLRADHWETTAVAELRAHAESLASHLLGAQEDARMARKVTREVASWSQPGHIAEHVNPSPIRHLERTSADASLR